MDAFLNAIPIFVPFFMFCQNGCELFTRLKQLNGVCNTADISSAPPLKNSTANQDFSVSTTVQRSLPHLGQKRAKNAIEPSASFALFWHHLFHFESEVL